MTIKCVIQITASFKTAYDFLLEFIIFITDLNQTLTRNTVAELSFKLVALMQYPLL